MLTVYSRCEVGGWTICDFDWIIHFSDVEGCFSVIEPSPKVLRVILGQPGAVGPNPKMRQIYEFSMVFRS